MFCFYNYHLHMMNYNESWCHVIIHIHLSTVQSPASLSVFNVELLVIMADRRVEFCVLRVIFPWFKLCVSVSLALNKYTLSKTGRCWYISALLSWLISEHSCLSCFFFFGRGIKNSSIFIHPHFYTDLSSTGLQSGGVYPSMLWMRGRLH